MIGDSIIKKLTSLLAKRGYRTNSDNLKDSLSIEPELFVKKGNEYQAYYIREGNRIPLFLIQKIALVNKFRSNTKLLHLYIFFDQKPPSFNIKEISNYGLGIKFVNQVNKIETVKKSRNFLERKPRISKYKLEKKISTIEVFISSHQKIGERKRTQKIINEFRNSYFIPFKPILIENHKNNDIKETNRIIKESIIKADWFLCIFADVYRPFVAREFKLAIGTKKRDNIALFVKSNRRVKTVWKKILRNIESKQLIKYFPYSDINDYENQLRGLLMRKIKKIEKKLNTDFFK